MEIIIVAILLSLVSMGMFVCALYFCLCLNPEERDRSLPRTSRVQTIPSAPADDWRLSVTDAGQEFSHLFPNTDHVNANANLDHIIFHLNDDQRIPSNNIDNRFNQDPDHGSVYPSTSNDYGFIYPTDHSFNSTANNGPTSTFHHLTTNVQYTSQYPVNQPSSRHKPLKKLETPPPSYVEATKGHNDSTNQQKHHYTCDRGLGFQRNGNVVESTIDKSGSRYVNINGIFRYITVNNVKGRHGHGSGYDGERGGDRNGNSYNANRGGNRNRLGYSRGRVVHGRYSGISDRGEYSGSRSGGGNSTGYSNRKNATRYSSSRDDGGEYSGGSRGGNGTGYGSRVCTTCDRVDTVGRSCDVDIGGGCGCGDANCVEITF